MHLPEVIALLIVLSFALEALVSGVMSVLAVVPGVGRFSGPPGSDEDMSAAKWSRALHFVLAAAVGFLFCWFGDFRVFKLLQYEGLPEKQLWDQIVTAILLASGSDGIAALRGKLGTPQAQGSGEKVPQEGASGSESKPIEIVGRVTFDEASSKKFEALEPEPEGTEHQQKARGMGIG